MCNLSDKIKFCTCSKDLSKEKHTWSFHRSINPYEMCLGITLGMSLDRKTFYENRAVLLLRLNEPHAFDVDLSPQENDYLLLAFTYNEKRGKECLGFVFKNGRWVEHTTMLTIPKIETGGCIENPFAPGVIVSTLSPPRNPVV